MAKKEKNPYENKSRLLLPLGSWADEFEDFLVMEEGVLHITDSIDTPGDHGTDYMYVYHIDYDHILMKCFFYQDYNREEDEKEIDKTTYIIEDEIFTKGVKSGKEAEEYKEGKLTKDEKKFHDELVRLTQPHLIEDDKGDRTPEALVKIKSYIFFQTLGKEKAKKFIELEIEKLGDKVSKEDLEELKEIMETGTIKRGVHYKMLYCLRNMREMAKDSPHAKDLEEHIKFLEEDEKNKE